MKIALLICCVLPVFLSPLAEAGITGKYKVRGTEYENGLKYTFTGTLAITQKNGKYVLTFNDGDKAAYQFKFATPLKETTAKQMVKYYSSLGTGTATFTYSKGHHNVVFSYKAKNADVRGSGTGTK